MREDSPSRSASKQSPRMNILGVGVSALTMESALQQSVALLQRGDRGYVCVTGVHGIIEAQKDEAFRRLLNKSFMTTPDGMPTVWLGRLRGFQVSRVYGPEYMLAVCEMSANTGYRHFLYGGRPNVAEELRTELVRRFPGIIIAGIYTPPFRPLDEKEEAELRAHVEAASVDIFWCGLSTPKQEKFIAAHYETLPVKLMVGVGAAFDLLSGNLRDAPKWMKVSGLQWFYRLIQEPRRLWRRYMVNNPVFVWLTMLQLLRLRRYRLE